ncbi:hypothetical protein FHL15_001491 [Xylaria flabelliformis]|uniref:Uncharacterized protein n=1 Tax=Xylaria flabelliformis TaxID=2512241 RepID=A0A553IC17_9PEZI|nr:hypothetical protein FHL15_001491 [Xylaria flabelliformis]
MAKKNKKARATANPSQPAVEAPQKKAIVVEWEKYMGHGELEDWQRLMRDLGFEEDFSSKSKCRKALKTVWVNIPDFLRAVKQGHPVHHFQSQSELALYTKRSKRFYPRDNIEKHSPLKQLLAHIVASGGKGYGGSALVVRMGGLSLA